MKTVVLDTNVLLADPRALFAYPGTEIVIPETVLSELDKLKTARIDPDLRFRGREVSRQIFELARDGSLTDGVDIEEGATLRIMPFEFNLNELPEGFSTRSPDEKILATAYLLNKALGEDDELLLVTNDLNMLLKAQALGIEVTQFGSGSDVSFAKRYILRPATRWRVPLTILALTIAVFGGVLAVGLRVLNDNAARASAVSTEFRNLLTSEQREAYNHLITLQSNPSDEMALLALAQYFSRRVEIAQMNGDLAGAISDAAIGIKYYEQYLSFRPTDLEARTDMARLYFYSGDTDRAIQEIAQVLDVNPDSVDANFMLGLFYWQGRNDTVNALGQFRKVKELAEGNDSFHMIYEQVLLIIEELDGDTPTSNRDRTTQGE